MEQYRERGIVVIPGFLSEVEVAELRKRIVSLVDVDAPDGSFIGDRKTYNIRYSAGFTTGVRLWKRDEYIRGLCTSPKVIALAQALLRTERVNLIMDQGFILRPGSKDKAPWHQDYSALPISGRQAANIWIPLDRCGPHTGALHFLKKTPATDKLRQPSVFAKFDQGWLKTEAGADDVETSEAAAADYQYEQADGYQPWEDVESAYPNTEILSWDMNAGDAIFFDLRIIHAVRNTPPEEYGQRVTYTLRIGGDDVRYHQRAGSAAFLHVPTLRTGDLLDCDVMPRIDVHRQ